MERGNGARVESGDDEDDELEAGMGAVVASGFRIGAACSRSTTV
jgi:hypothetical protein